MSEASYPTGTITFLFTDIEGSTGLWEHHPEAMRSAVARHDALLREAVEAHNGYLFKMRGDGIAAAFSTAFDAVASALESQIALGRELWPAPASIRVRIGLHTSSAEYRAGDYFGPALNRCARLMDAGHGGQILMTEAVQDSCRDNLPEHATLISLGTHRLKDLILPERIFQICHPSLTQSFPALQTLGDSQFAHNLPNQITSFVGRDAAIRDVRTLLNKARLVTLTGAGGSGKTRLSLQVASDLRDAFPDGVWQVELAPLSDSALVVQAVSSVLAVREQTGQPIQTTLIDCVKHKTLLLVLDNAEHVLVTCLPLVAAIVRDCRHIKVIVTSREPLRIAGEVTYRVPSLSQPTSEQIAAASPENLRRFEAVRLFSERAQYVRPDFAVTEANASAVAEICRRLDGMPLAIELAAARVRSLGVDEINGRLGDRFRLLSGGDRSALPRQQTLRALVDWSYDLLTVDERLLLARLSVFAGGWTNEAAEAVCGFAPLSGDAVLDLLTSLADKSLVLAEMEETTVRYRFLETLRQYAAEKATDDGGFTEAGDRHTSFFLALAEAAEPHFAGTDEALWSRRLTTEHDNLRAALDRCTAPPGRSAVTGLKLAGALFSFWYVRGYFGEGREHIERGLSAWKSVGLEPAGPSASDMMIVARAAGAAGAFASSQADFGAAAALLEQSRSLYERLGDTRGIANVLNKLGIVAYNQGDYSVARAHYSESLNHYRSVGDEKKCSGPLNNLGLVAYRERDYAAARLLYEESLTIYRRAGDKHGIASSFGNMGLVAQGEGDYAAASELLMQSLILYRELEARLSISSTLINLGTVAVLKGEYESAQSYYEESLTLCLEAGHDHGIAHARTALGDVASARGDWSAARAYYHESLAFYCQVGDKLAIAECMGVVATACIGQGDIRRAAVLWAAASSMREEIGAPLPPADEATRDRDLHIARAALGDKDFRAASDEGRAMTSDQAAAAAVFDASVY